MNRVAKIFFLGFFFLGIYSINAAEISSTENAKIPNIFFYDNFIIFKSDDLIEAVDYDAKIIGEMSLGKSKHKSNSTNRLKLEGEEFSWAYFEQKEKDNECHYQKIKPYTNFADFFTKLVGSYKKKDKFETLYKFLVVNSPTISHKEMKQITEQFNNKRSLTIFMLMCLRDYPTFAHNMIKLFRALKSDKQKYDLYVLLSHLGRTRISSINLIHILQGISEPKLMKKSLDLLCEIRDLYIIPTEHWVKLFILYKKDNKRLLLMKKISKHIDFSRFSKEERQKIINTFNGPNKKAAENLFYKSH